MTKENAALALSQCVIFTISLTVNLARAKFDIKDGLSKSCSTFGSLHCVVFKHAVLSLLNVSTSFVRIEIYFSVFK